MYKRQQKEIDEEKAIEEKRLNDIQKIRDDFEQKVKEEKATKESEKLALEQEKKLAELEELDATEAQKADIILYYRNLISEAQDKEDKADLERTKIAEAAKINMVKNTFGNIARALGQNSKAGKAFAAAQALINTYQGISAELATKTATPFDFALKLANIASTAAIGFKSVKDILKTDPKSTGGGGASASVSSRGGGSQAPAFNIVGAGVTNQLADAIAGQSQEPTRAYVVSSDVSTAQELDRNIVEGASIG